MKVPVSDKAQRCKQWFKQIYSDAHKGRDTLPRSGSLRLPEAYQKALVADVAQMCNAAGVTFRHCKHDVLTRR